MATINLDDLLTRVCEHQIRREHITAQHAARVELRDMTPAKRRTRLGRRLKKLADGNLDDEAAVADQEVHAVLRRLWKLATKEVRVDESRRLGCPPSTRTTWEVVVETIIPDAQRVTRTDLYGENADHSHWVCDYCNRLLRGEQVSGDWFAEGLRILREGSYAEQLLNRLWVECNAECQVIPLPRPPDLMTDGQRAVWDALEGEAAMGKELANQLFTSNDVIRRHIGVLNKMGFRVENRRGRGYYRPDAPPDAL